MKKFNVSHIVPIFYILASALLFVLSLVCLFGGGVKIFMLFVIPAAVIAAENIAAIRLIIRHNLDLRHNLFSYLIMVFISAAAIVVSVLISDSSNSKVVLYAFPIATFILINLGFWFDNDRREYEALIWFLLNPNLYYIVFLICIYFFGTFVII